MKNGFFPKGIRVSGFLILTFLFLTFNLAWVAQAGAEAGKYPAKQIRIMIPAGPGGSLGAEIRAIQQFFEKYAGAKTVIDYVTGASGLIAYNKFPNESKDGYTIMHYNLISALTLQLTRSNAKYDVTKYSLIGGWNAKYQVLVVPPGTWETFDDFLKDAKKKKLVLAGTGGHTILNVNVMESALGVKFSLVPYKSAGEGIAAVAGKHVDFLMTYETTPKPMIDAGKLKALAVLSYKPDPILPTVPNLKELKHEEIPPIPAIGNFAAPPGTPKEIVAYLEKALSKATADPEFLKIAEKSGTYVDFVSSEEMQQEALKQYKIVDQYKHLIK